MPGNLRVAKIVAALALAPTEVGASLTTTREASSRLDGRDEGRRDRWAVGRVRSGPSIEGSIESR